MTIRDFLTVVWAGRWYVLASMVLVVAGAFLYTQNQTSEYQAVAQVRLGAVGQAPEGQITPDSDPAIVTSPEVVAGAAELLGVDPATLDAMAVGAAYDSASRFMTVQARAETAEEAAAVANAFAGAYADYLPVIVDAQVGALDEQIARVSKQVSRARKTLEETPKDPVASALEETGMDTLTELSAKKTAFQSLVTPGQVVSPAQGAAPLALSSRNILAIALLAGLVAGVGVAFLRKGLDTRVRSSAQALAAAEAPVLAELGGVARALKQAAREDSMPVASRAATPFTESVRELRTAVQVGLENRQHVAVVVSAADPRAPRAFVAANLAVSFALSGRRTIVLSGDMRRPQIEAMLPPPEDWSGPRHQLRPTRVPYLEVCPVPDVELDPADYLATNQARDLVEALCRRGDIVVIDAPPILAAADATILGSYAEGVVLVVDVGRTHRGVLNEAADRLRTNNVSLIGMAVSGVRVDRHTEYAVTYGESRTTGTHSGPGLTPGESTRPAPEPSSPRSLVPVSDAETQQLPIQRPA